MYIQYLLRWLPGWCIWHRDLLHAGLSEEQTPMVLRDFLSYIPIQTGPGAHPAFPTVGIGGSYG